MISACIVCRNEADKLGPCLESVRWADEVLVLDLRSADGSAELAARLGARVIPREPHPIVEPLRNELADAAAGEWVLALDPDERVTPGLAEELRRIAPRDDVDAVVVPRMNVDLGFPPSNPLHRYEPQLRMYRRDRVRWPEFPNTLPALHEERLHRVAHRDELVLVHERNRNVPEIVERIGRYAPAQARAMHEAGQRFTAQAMLSDLSGYAYKQFVRGEAWKDGVPGFLRAGILVAWRFYVWTALWQVSGVGRTAEDDRTIGRLAPLFAAWRRGAALRRRAGCWREKLRRRRSEA